MRQTRNLILVLGDQLSHEAAVFDDFDPSQDAVWMAEVDHESTRFWYHKQHIALFFAAMRHFRDELRARGITVHYHQLTPRKADDRGPDFPTILRQDTRQLQPARLIMTRPGDYHVLEALQREAQDIGLALEVRADRHFYITVEDFQGYAAERKRLRLEYFYRFMRARHHILMTSDLEPVGGQWNFDQENRETFSIDGPGEIERPLAFTPDATTREVLELVEQRFASNPGTLEHFDLPVTHAQAQEMLEAFVQHSLPNFGPYEDAMWADEPFLYHSRLSAPLNLKLVSPQACVEAALQAYATGHAPINSVEGFVRQILGWREFVRGVYWLHMPGYAAMNALEHELDLPRFFWDGETDMVCVQQTMGAILKYGYTHHIQRLMVMGLFAQLLGVHPYKFHEWHMAMYLDAVDWVSLPNALGMSQYGDGGIMGSKPYCASGNYINKMSNYCPQCRYDYRAASGENACPFTTLYWDFLDRHYDRLAGNNRMRLQLRNLERKRADQAEISAIRKRAQQLKKRFNPR